jgi:hypothetical protein
MNHPPQKNKFIIQECELENKSPHNKYGTQFNLHRRKDYDHLANDSPHKALEVLINTIELVKTIPIIQ